MSSRWWRRVRRQLAAVTLVATGVVTGVLLGRGLPQAGPRPLPRVEAVTSQADGSFAVCTAPLDPSMEGFFMLDFETGDLSGGVLSPSTSQFASSYKYNVLKDLGFKAGQVKNPKFLLVSGIAEMRRGAGITFAQSVLYVTDSSTGTTVAYGIPWNAQQPQAAQLVPLVPLDVARPRGGGAKAK